MKRKIHCIEMEQNPDKIFSMKELNEMVGWIEPPNNGVSPWDVTMADGCGFECKDQATAQILASLEEIKAIEIKRYLNELKGGIKK